MKTGFEWTKTDSCDFFCVSI